MEYSPKGTYLLFYLKATLENEIVRNSFEVLTPEGLQWSEVVRRGETEPSSNWNKWIDDSVVDEATQRLTGSNRDAAERRTLRRLGIHYDPRFAHTFGFFSLPPHSGFFSCTCSCFHGTHALAGLGYRLVPGNNILLLKLQITFFNKLRLDYIFQRKCYIFQRKCVSHHVCTAVCVSPAYTTLCVPPCVPLPGFLVPIPPSFVPFPLRFRRIENCCFHLGSLSRREFRLA